MNRLEYFFSALVLRAWYLVCTLVPIRANKVVLASARTRTLQGNLLFVYQELRKARPDVECVLLLDRYSYSFAGKLRYLWRLLRGTYHLATARLFVVDNAYLPVHIGPHRKGTTVVQVWHAGGALKKFGLDTAPPNRKVENRFLHRYYDYVVVSSESSRASFASALRTDVDRVLPLGMPRSDFFFDSQAMAEARERVLAQYPQLRGRTVVLYAPTFRGHGTKKEPGQQLDARTLRDRLPADTALVHKTHPVFAAADVDHDGYDVVIGAELEINDLFTVADVFVTDYSSSVFEWVLLHRPLILLVSDLEQYERDPGLYVDLRAQGVGELAWSTDDVARILECGDYDVAAYDAFIAEHCSGDDGHAGERFVERFLPR